MASNASSQFPNAPDLVTTAMALAMVVNFDAQDLNHEESLTDQETTFWSSHEHLWQSSITHKLLTCTSVDDKNLGGLKMFEEEIIFDTAADDDLEFTSEDDIFPEDALCIPFSTSLFPHHNQSIIQEVLQESTLQDVLHGFVSPSLQFVASRGSTPLQDCFYQVPKLIHPKHDLKHRDLLQFHLPVLYKVVGRLLQDMHLCFQIDTV